LSEARNRMRESGWLRGGPLSRVRLVAGLVWLGFVVAPIVQALGDTGPAVGHWLAVAGAVAFSGSYIWLLISWFDQIRRGRGYALSAFQLAIATVLTVADRPSWGFLFTYCAACVALVAPRRTAFPPCSSTARWGCPPRGSADRRRARRSASAPARSVWGCC
jgi:hypothetical protein